MELIPKFSRYPVTTTGTQAVDRAAALVAMVVHADEPISFTELAEVSGLARSTTSRLLTALERNQLLERDGGGSFRSGPLFALYAARHDPWAEVVRLAQPELQRLGDAVRESVYLTIPRGRSSTVQLAQVDASYVLGARDWRGIDVPPHCTAAGKVLYAYGCLDLPDGDGPDRLLPRLTARSIGSRSDLVDALAAVPRRGYATTDQELEVGLCAVAAPVRGRDGGVVAAVGAHGPSTRMSRQLDQVGQLLVEHAEKISALLLRRTRKEGAA
jgi:IclR family transcriptional regulator, acetate operon repressor